MPDFPWYSDVSYSADLNQGDLLADCPIPFPHALMYQAILESDGTTEESISVEKPIEIKNGNLIVLSQACDLQNEKLDTVVLCQYWPLKTIMQKNDYYNSKNGRESLRQGKEPAYHLLNRYQSEFILLEYSVVDFHRIYTLPKEYLHAYAITQKHRIRLLPPYREHLSQAFARYFMRVGLLVDINRNEISNLSIS